MGLKFLRGMRGVGFWTAPTDDDILAGRTGEKQTFFYYVKSNKPKDNLCFLHSSAAGWKEEREEAMLGQDTQHATAFTRESL